MNEAFGFFILSVFVFIMPIISYYLSIPDVLPKQAYIQVYLSGPILLILGLILFFNYSKKVVAIFFLITALWWILSLMYELVYK
jgi:hypothetical protein